MPRNPDAVSTFEGGRRKSRNGPGDVTRRLSPVLWTKGALLTPQHLQQQDRYLEDCLSFRLSAVNFRPYGFAYLELDRYALGEGQVAITGAAGILKDGLVFDIPRADAAPPARMIADVFAQGDSVIDVYLGIQRQRSDRALIAEAGRNAETRFVPEIIEVRDETRGGSGKPVHVVRKNFRLLTSAERLEGWELLPVARVRRLPSGIFKEDETFIPPLLDYHASGRLEALASGILQALTARMSELSDFRRPKITGTTDFSAADTEGLGILHSMHTSFPVLKHLMQVSPTHPERLYMALLSLAGGLMSFAGADRPAELPAYNHDDLTSCFNALTTRVDVLLQTSVRKPWLSVPLRSVAPSIYAGAFDEPEVLTAAQVFLAIAADVEPDVLIRKVPEMLIAGAGTRIDHLVGHAMPGIGLTYVPRPPAALPVRRDHVYYRLDQKDGGWPAVVAAASLAVYIPAAFPNPRAEMLILLPEPR